MGMTSGFLSFWFKRRTEGLLKAKWKMMVKLARLAGIGTETAVTEIGTEMTAEEIETERQIWVEEDWVDQEIVEIVIEAESETGSEIAIGSATSEAVTDVAGYMVEMNTVGEMLVIGDQHLGTGMIVIDQEGWVDVDHLLDDH